ncbi:MAG: ABC transporter permease [Treponema sp.]|jgi:peptide/nickel transport system permease protein|nr:ABC transporter permease [Treponema sp.]
MQVPWSIDFKIGVVLALLVGGMVVVSLFYTPYEYNRMAPSERFTPPGRQHLMGTDNFGRDVFSRIMIGTKYTLFVSVCTVLGSALMGASLGLISGYQGGLWDEVLMRLMDTLSSFPGILVALMMVSLMENKPYTLMIALLILFIPSYVRIMRSGILEYKNRDFVKTAGLMGASHIRIIFVHILPNLRNSLFSATVLGLSNAILAEATMSYLGLGIQPPIPSWGRMLSESQNFLFNAPWCALAPGMMIMITVIAFHGIGEGIRQRYW